MRTRSAGHATHLSADGRDDGGLIDWARTPVLGSKVAALKPIDWGLRLWDPAKRRQPPAAQPENPAGDKADAKPN